MVHRGVKHDAPVGDVDGRALPGQASVPNVERKDSALVRGVFRLKNNVQVNMQGGMSTIGTTR